MEKKTEQPADEFAGIANPVQGALTHAGMTTLEQVSKMTPKELLKMHGIGPKGIRQLRDAMAARGLKFADE